MGDKPTIEELNRRLGEIQDQLLALDPSDFAEKHRLKTEQDRLRNLAADYRQDRDTHRTSEDLLAELKAREQALDAFRKKLPEAAKAASAGLGPGAWEGPGDIQRLNEGIKSAHGIEELTQRIAKLQAILKERGDL
jgi:peptidoglycan hydrolase CwlO-like protein